MSKPGLSTGTKNTWATEKRNFFSCSAIQNTKPNKEDLSLKPVETFLFHLIFTPPEFPNVNGRPLRSRFVLVKLTVSLTNRFHVAVRLFSSRSQMTSKCGKNKKVAHEAQPSVSLMFLPHFDVLCDLLMNRRTATWNLFVYIIKNLNIRKKCIFISNIATLTDTKIALTWGNVYTKWRELIGCYA